MIKLDMLSALSGQIGLSLTLGAYTKQYKQRCHTCDKYSHKPGDHRCPEYKKENKKDKKTEQNDQRNKKFNGLCYHCGRKGHMSNDCRERKYNNNKRYEKPEKAIDGDEDDLVLCLLMMEIEKNIKKKALFA